MFRGNYRYHIRHYRNIEKCIEECIDEDTIDYLEAIKQDMLIFKLEILKHITIDKMLKEKQHERIHNQCI